MKTVHLLISGKVQGVFFRETARKIAEQFNIKGWIKNTKDEKVEAVISGEKESIDDFVDWCRIGPERAKVKDIIISEHGQSLFEKFEVIRYK